MSKEILKKNGISFIKQRIYNIFKHRRTLWDMSASQLKAKYAGLKLGAWWVIIIPLVMAFCINFIFVSVFKVSIPNYLFFILSGIFPWFFISQAVIEATNSFYVNKNILRQGIFPQELIPISSVLSSFVNFIFGFAIIILLFLLINKSLIFLLPLLILIIFFNLVFVLGLGLIFAVLNSFARDTAYFLSVGMMFWFWITPVFYSEKMLNFPHRWICLLNPATYYISAYRKVIYSGEFLPINDIFILFLISFITLILGYLFYLRNEAEILKKI
ncbi:MAG: ABC transporter permease [Candidatus Omnitrophota bacterium]